MRSVINLASKTGIAAIARQQFEIGEQIAEHGLMPILEPEVSIKSPEKAAAEAILRDELTQGLDALPPGPQGDVQADVAGGPGLLYAADRGQARRPRRRPLRRLHEGRGGKRLAANHGMIASFSRALVQDLRVSMSDAEFNAALASAIDEIYRASTVKV